MNPTPSLKPTRKLLRPVKYCDATVRRRPTTIPTLRQIISRTNKSVPFPIRRAPAGQRADRRDSSDLRETTGKRAAAVYMGKQSDGRPRQFIRSVRRQIELRAAVVVGWGPARDRSRRRNDDLRPSVDRSTAKRFRIGRPPSPHGWKGASSMAHLLQPRRRRGTRRNEAVRSSK